MDRRSFVKGCVAAAGVGVAAATGFSMARPSAIPRPPAGPPITYFSTHKVGGPAPRGAPLIPIALENGEFVGRADLAGPDGASILDWYKYCGHASAPGLSPSYTGDSVLRYFIAEDKIKLGVKVWYLDLLGKPIRPEHFQPGEGAGFIWRSEGQSGPNVLTGAIIRAPSVEAFTNDAPRFVPPAKRIKDSEWETVKSEFLHIAGDAGFVAASTFCPHFCCIPGWKEAEKLASSVVDPVNGGNANDRLFCTCHFSVYQPFQLATYVFQPEIVREKPTGSGGGGGH